MPIQFTCPQCNQELRVGDEHGGRQVRCPYCQQVAVAPQPAAPQVAQPTDPFQQPQQPQENPFAGPQVRTGPSNASRGSMMHRNIPDYLVQAILVTLFCCVPFGVVSIVFATQVGGHKARGDYSAARNASNMAKNWALAGFICGILPIPLWFLVVLASAAG